MFCEAIQIYCPPLNQSSSEFGNCLAAVVAAVVAAVADGGLLLTRFPQFSNFVNHPSSLSPPENQNKPTAKDTVCLTVLYPVHPT